MTKSRRPEGPLSLCTQCSASENVIHNNTELRICKPDASLKEEVAKVRATISESTHEEDARLENCRGWNRLLEFKIKSINIASIRSSSEIFQGKLIYIIINKLKMFKIKL